jgi:hypothetical protein
MDVTVMFGNSQFTTVFLNIPKKSHHYYTPAVVLQQKTSAYSKSGYMLQMSTIWRPPASQRL